MRYQPIRTVDGIKYEAYAVDLDGRKIRLIFDKIPEIVDAEFTEEILEDE